MPLFLINKVGKIRIWFECRYTLDEFGEEANWIYLTPSTSAKMIITEITLGRSIWVQVRCINGKGKGDWSDPALLKFIH